MKLYHRTFHSIEILEKGFKDTTGTYLTSKNYTGVWFSNTPLDLNEGAEGNLILQLDIPAKIIKKYEWVEEGKPYREWLIPASLVNKYPIKLLNA